MSTGTNIEGRIAEAMARTSEPKMTLRAQIAPKGGVILGEVPVPLRHLHNLIVEIEEEQGKDADASFLFASERFFDELAGHMPIREFGLVGIYGEWKVVGYSSSDSPSRHQCH